MLKRKHQPAPPLPTQLIVVCLLRDPHKTLGSIRSTTPSQKGAKSLVNL